jgi:hypothetical protein
MQGQKTLNTNNNSNSSFIKQNQFINGWSWGEIKINDNSIKLESNRQEWFSINPSSISNVIVANKNELGIEYNIEDEYPQG